MSRPTNTRFAVAYHALALLASIPDDPLSSEQMAYSAGVSPVYLRRVLGALRRAGIVTSRPGVNGGWLLARAPESITLGEAWRAVKGDEPVLGIHDPPAACPIGGPVGERLVEVEAVVGRAVELALDAQTVAEIVPDGGPFTVATITPPG